MIGLFISGLLVIDFGDNEEIIGILLFLLGIFWFLMWFKIRRGHRESPTRNSYHYPTVTDQNVITTYKTASDIFNSGRFSTEERQKDSQTQPIDHSSGCPMVEDLS